MNFGTPVVVTRELVRVRCHGQVIGDPSGTLGFNPCKHRRDFGRYDYCQYVYPPATEWPGDAIPLDLVPKSRPMGLLGTNRKVEDELEPVGVALAWDGLKEAHLQARLAVRCRTFPTMASGVVIGQTIKQEGRSVPYDGDGGDGYLDHWRDIPVLEVAVWAPNRKRGSLPKGRIILAHPSHVKVLG